MTGLLDRALPHTTLKLAALVTLLAVAGCQDKAPPQSAEPAPAPVGKQVILTPGWESGSGNDRIFFEFDSSKITPESREIIIRWERFAENNPQLTFTLEGHCDEHGTREYNLALGERRAEAARRAWVAIGLAPGRVQTVSYGSERPAAIGHDEAAWAQNRRAVAVVN